MHTVPPELGGAWRFVDVAVQADHRLMVVDRARARRSIQPADRRTPLASTIGRSSASSFGAWSRCVSDRRAVDVEDGPARVIELAGEVRELARRSPLFGQLARRMPRRRRRRTEREHLPPARELADPVLGIGDVDRDCTHDVREYGVVVVAEHHERRHAGATQALLRQLGPAPQALVCDPCERRRDRGRLLGELALPSGETSTSYRPIIRIRFRSSASAPSRIASDPLVVDLGVPCPTRRLPTIGTITLPVTSPAEDQDVGA